MKEEQKLLITQKAEKTGKIKAIPGKTESAHYLCVKKFISGMKKGDSLCAESVSDFGKTGEEATVIR